MPKKINVSDGDELTQAELEYLESGGAKDEGLVTEDTQSGGAGDDDDEAARAAAAAAGEDTQSGGEDTQSGGDDDDDGDDDDAAGEDDDVNTDAAGRKRDKSGKFVSHKALHKERERRKAIAKENEALRDKLSRGDERLQILNEAFQGNAAGQGQQQGQQGQQAGQGSQRAGEGNPYEEAEIDPTEDFFGWAKQLERRNSYLANQLQSQQTGQQQRDTMQTVTTAYHQDAARLLQEDPNFEPAYMHLVEQRRKELEFMGVADPAKRDAIIAQEESGLVIKALNSGKSPAQMIYELAKHRGYTPKAPNPNGENGQGGANGQQQQGQQQQGAVNPENVAAAQSKVANLKAGKAAAETLSFGKGSAGETLTIGKLADMPQDEFEAVFDRLPKAEQEKLLGKI